MKKTLFYTFLLVYVLTAIIALLGITNKVKIDDKYLEKLFYAVLIESAVSVIVLFKKTEFLEENNRFSLALIPKNSFNRDNDPHKCNIIIYSKETDKEKILKDKTLVRENGYLCVYIDKVNETELVKIKAWNAKHDEWESEYCSPSITKVEMERK